MNTVTVYTTPSCPYCVRAKKLLSSLEIPFEEVDVSTNHELREQMAEKYEWQTVPMILIGDKFVGGYDDLVKLHASGELQHKIQTQ
jgi:glutaredoxin 3